MAHAAYHDSGVGLDRHPAAPAVALLPAPEVPRERAGIDGQPRREAIDDDDEHAAVRFAGCEKTQHRAVILYEVSAPLRLESP
jgi:hypothetical protein